MANGANTSDAAFCSADVGLNCLLSQYSEEIQYMAIKAFFS